AAAGRALHGLRAAAAAGAGAVVARHEARHLDLAIAAEGRLLEAHPQRVAQVLAATTPAARASGARAEELVEQVAEEVLEAARAEVEARGAALERSVTVAVVARTLGGIGQDLVGLRGLAELGLGELVTRVPVGMVLEGELAEGLLDRLLVGGAIDPQPLVEVSFR